MNTNSSLHSYQLNQTETYLMSTLFVIGNLLMPQLCHFAGGSHAGHVWLPIYLFTLIGAYKYSFAVGLITAVFSPIVNHLLFGMPPLAVLPSILCKSVVLAVVAAMVAEKTKKVTLLTLLATILTYQVIGTLAEFALFQPNFYAAISDFRVGVPGMLMQLFGGYALLKYVLNK
ncbi:MAG: ECF transporter S component [Bacteroidales bacterium]|nr:ECF transporter S component [Candidatus Scybalocola fimicaballi]